MKLKKLFEEYEDVIKKLNPFVISMIAFRVGNELSPNDNFYFQVYMELAYDILDIFNLMLTDTPNEKFINTLKKHLEDFKLALQEGKEEEYYDLPKRNQNVK